MSADRRINAMDIHNAVEELDHAYRRVMAIIAGFDQTGDEAALASEIDNDIDRAIAKLRFYFTTLKAAGDPIHYALECEWGECPGTE